MLSGVGGFLLGDGLASDVAVAVAVLLLVAAAVVRGESVLISL